MEPDKKKSLFNRYFFVLLFINVSISVMMFAMNATLTLYMTSIGYSTSVSGTLVAIGALSAAVYSFFGGRLSNRIGRKPLIAAGLILFGIGAFMLSRSSSLPVLIIFRIIQMAGYSMVLTSAAIALIDVIPKERIGEGVGYSGLGNSLGQSIGPSFALALYYRFDNGFLAVVSAILVIGLISAVLTFTLLNYESKPDYTRPVPAADKAAKGNGGIWSFLEKKAIPASAINCLFLLSTSVITIYLTLYAERSGIPNAGLFFILSVIAMVLARLFFGRLSDRHHVLIAVVPGLILIIIGYVMLIAGPTYHWMFYAAGALYGLGSGITTPALNAQAVRRSGHDRTAAATATYQLLLNLAFVLGPIILGIIIDVMSFRSVFIVCIGVVILAIALSVLLLKESGKPARLS